MITDLRASIEAAREELRLLDGRLAEAEAVEPLAIARGLVALDAIRGKVVKLTASIKPPPPDPGPTLPGVGGPDQGAAEPRGRGRRRPAGR